MISSLGAVVFLLLVSSPPRQSACQPEMVQLFDIFQYLEGIFDVGISRIRRKSALLIIDLCGFSHKMAHADVSTE
jgi:hypothetical protein